MDMNKVKGHPGFMPFGCANVKSDTSDTQSKKDQEISEKETKSDISRK